MLFIFLRWIALFMMLFDKDLMEYRPATQNLQASRDKGMPW
jgi:hypothetical protein